MAGTCSRTLLLLALASTGAALGQTPASVPPIAPTAPLGEPDHTAHLESDAPEMRYQHGLFVAVKYDGTVSIRDKDGHLTNTLTLPPPEKNTLLSPSIADWAIFKDGSIVASWAYMMPHDMTVLFLFHYDPAGAFLDKIDLGKWRASRICIAADNSVWTLSGEEEGGHALYSPDPRGIAQLQVGRDLQAGFTLQLSAGVPKLLPNGNVAIDCSGDKIHALTDDGQWIEYTPGGDFTITKVERLSHTEADYYKLSGFAYLDENHIYGFMESRPGKELPNVFAELLPAADGKGLQWVEIPDKALPANNHPPESKPNPDSNDLPQPPITVRPFSAQTTRAANVSSTAPQPTIRSSGRNRSSPAPQLPRIPQKNN